VSFAVAQKNGWSVAFGSAPDPEWSQTPAIRVAVRTLMGGALVNPTRQLEASAEPSLRNPRHVLA
jgi:hypothetical protein